MENQELKKIDFNNINLKIASVLLEKNREISLDEIKALPLITEEIAELIKNTLLELYDAQLFQRKRTDSIIARWEEIIVLKD